MGKVGRVELIRLEEYGLTNNVSSRLSYDGDGLANAVQLS